MATLTPIEDVSDISEAYIMQVMQQHYSSSITRKITPFFLKQMVYSYKQKAKNLDWLFKGKTTITIQPDAEKILKGLLSESAYGIREITGFLKSVGATYTAKQLQDNKCTWNKQEMRISRVISLSADSDIIKAVLAKDAYSGSVTRNPSSNGIVNVDQVTDTVILKDLTRWNRDSFDVTDGSNIWIRSSSKLYECIHKSQSSMSIKRAIDEIDIVGSLAQIDSGTVVMSIEINDFITASNGGVSSCFGFTGMHHMGWMNVWRADFGIIIYMQNKSDRFSKIGRQWLLMKMSEDGEDFEAPTFKFQRPYGRIQRSHTELVTSYVFDAIKEKWGYIPSQFIKITDGNVQAVSVSDNMLQEGGSSSRHSGFFDRSFASESPGYQLKEDVAYEGQYLAFPGMGKDSKYQDGRSLIFNFPDALSPAGQPTNSGNFESHQAKRSSSGIGANKPARLVKCAVSGEEVLNLECTRMPDGSMVKTSILIKSFNPALVEDEPKKEVVEVTPVVEAILPEEVLQFDEDDF